MPHESDGCFPYLIGDIVADNACWNPDSVALIFQDRTTSWAQFAAITDQLANGLSQQGIVRGSRVAMLDRNSDDYVFLHYALGLLGAVLVPINIWLRAPEIGYILGNAQPKLLVTSDEFRDLAEQASQGLVQGPAIATRGTPRHGDLAWAALLVHAAPPARSQPHSWDDAHMVLFTSGTTGRPKGALISHRRSVLDAMSGIGAFGIRRGGRFFCYMPLFHTGAWDYLILYFMQHGSAVIVERFEPEEAVQAIAHHRCTGMFGVPVVMRRMVESAAWATADLSAMTLIAYANYDPSNLILDITAAFRARGARTLGIANAYGMTESGPYITILRPEDAEARPNSIGTPVPGVRVVLLDKTLTEVPRGEIGEICARSPALMSGYLNRPEETEEAFAGGWLHTGDLGRVDAEGFLYLVDRQKAMIRSGGENVYAKEVEQVLVTHPGVLECAVFGMPDNDYGERVVAAIIAGPGCQPDPDEVMAFVRARIAGFKTPRRVVVLDSLPKTPAGKVQKHVLRTIVEGIAPAH